MSIHARHTVPFELPASEPADQVALTENELLVEPVHRDAPTEECAAGRYFDQCVRKELPAALEWLRVDSTGLPDHTGIGVMRPGRARYTAQFTLELSSVGTGTLANTPGDSPMSDAEHAERARQEGWSSLAQSLTAGQQLRVVHEAWRLETGESRYRVLIEGKACGASEEISITLARLLHEDVRMALAVGAGAFGFKGLPIPVLRSPTRWKKTARLIPAGVTILGGKVPTVAEGPTVGALDTVTLPLVARDGVPFLRLGLEAFLSCQDSVELVLELTPCQLDLATAQRVQVMAAALMDTASCNVRLAGLNRLADGPTPEELLTLQRSTSRWLADPRAVTLTVTLHGHQLPAPSSLVLGNEVWQGRPFRVELADSEVRSEQSIQTSYLAGLLLPGLRMPPLLPDPAMLRAMGLRKHYAQARFELPHSGTVIGDLPLRTGMAAVRMSPEAWSRHCYVIGATGAGKTKLLERMLMSHIEQGHGVGLLDPHGDLCDAVLAACPPDRLHDVVLLDFADFNAAPGINLLEPLSDRPDVERTFIVHDLVQMLQRMYPGNPEAFGPMFTVYLTNGAKLSMEDPTGLATVLDVPRVFSNAVYRRALLEQCTNDEVAEFWRGIAGRAGGDASLENIAPYIVSKFVELQQPPVKAIVGQRHSTVNMRAIMDGQRILLVKLAKGELSERQCHFLGMLVSSLLFRAALSRSKLRPAERVPFHLFIDEFQNFMSPTLEGLLAEVRKYGMSLTLAHQNLAQLPSSMAQAVLANCGNKFLMRLGPQDAAHLAPWVAPHFSAEELVSLPDRHAVARIQLSDAVSPPFLLRTRPVAPATADAATASKVEAIRKLSRASHCRPVLEVEREIALHRKAHQAPVPSSEPEPALINKLKAVGQSTSASSPQATCAVAT